MTKDDLFRTASEAAGRSSAFERLARASEDDLYAELVQRVAQATRAAPSAQAFDAPLDVDNLTRGDEQKALGRRIFLRWSRVLHGFICQGGAEDEDLKRRLLTSLTGKGGGSALVAAALVSVFGVSPAIAAVIATLVIRLVVAPAADEVCGAWARSLTTSAGQKGA